MRDLLRRTFGIAILVLAVLASPARADKTFNIGSLIIPPGASYQTDCGAVSVYGLVYNVLRANAWLAAQPVATAPGGAIQIYYTFKDTKKSPNRCTPTNKSTPPTLPADPRWLDGCDFEIYNNAATPVRRVVNTATAIANDVDIQTINRSADTKVYPGYASETVSFASGYNTVRYLGAPFVIDDVDAATFLKLLDGTITALDSDGNAIDFSPFKSGACAFPGSNGGQVNIHRSYTVFTAPAAKAFVDAPPRLALLATQGGVSSLSFDYPEWELETWDGASSKSGTTITFITKNSHTLAVNDWVKVQGVNNGSYNGTYQVASIGPKKFTVTVAAGALPTSKKGKVILAGASKSGTTITIHTAGNHGFSVTDSVDVANSDVAGYNGTWTVTGVPTTSSITITTAAAPVLAPSFANATIQKSGTTAGVTGNVYDGILQKYLKNAGLAFSAAGGCPAGGANIGDLVKCPNGNTPGQIYDTFDFSDVLNNKLDIARYKMIWTPHWESTATEVVAPNAGEIAAIAKISSFLDNQSGLMAECHSIATFEGNYVNGGMYNFPDFSSSFFGGSTMSGLSGQFQTCVMAVGVCTGSTTPFGIDKNRSNPAQNNTYQNCTDPGLAAGVNCVFFSDPGDPFSQTGDFKWNNQQGSVQNYLPNTSVSSAYRPGVKPLISGVVSLNLAKTGSASAARAMITADYATRSNKDNDTTKGNILYVSGHDVSAVVSGSKMILQTLLLLGEPPIVQTSQEVTRSSPILSTIGGTQALVQGSFLALDPPDTTPTMDTDADATGFRFPDVVGHMRAISASTVTTTQADLNSGSLTVLFDAATLLPPTSSSYSPGCTTNAFKGTCRTIFTSTATSMPGNRVLFESANSTTLGALIGVGSTITTAEYPTLIQRIIAGIEDPVGSGTFVPKLGGVDRSSVAVVPVSLVAGGARPKVIYFGARDGMLHAVCGDTIGACATAGLGAELWGFVPRHQLQFLRKNTARIDGSPRVMDLFGDFTTGTGTGTRRFRTILLVQTASGDPATTDKEPSVTAMDVTDPTDPKVIWDHALPGQGLVVNAGRVTINGINKNFAFVQTNKGAVTAGDVVMAIDMETGAEVWRNTYTFAIANRTGGTSLPPVTGIPGGAVGVDKQQTGNLSDIVFGTLYGDMWLLDAATGTNRHGTNPLFRYKFDKHPLGAPPTIYSNSGQLFALGSPGGYADQAATTLWTTSPQTIVAVSLGTPTASTPLDETSGAPYVPWTFALNAGDNVFAQAVVVGGEVFITADSVDVNANGIGGYGTNHTDTGHVYQVNVGTGVSVSTVVVRGGAGSVQTNGTDVYNVSKDKAEQLASSATGTSGASVGSPSTPRVTRLLWLRTL